MKTISKLTSLSILSLSIAFFANCALPTESYFATYKLLYDGNDNTAGTVPLSPYDFKYGDEVRVQDNVGSLQKNGGVFLHWNTKPDNTGISYLANDTINILSKDIVLYAQYTAGTTPPPVIDPPPVIPPVEKVSFSGPEFFLNWDYTATNTGTYTVYVRDHGTTDWTVLSQNLADPSLTVNASILAYGEYDFAVSFTVQGGAETEQHTSLEATAIPMTGWYLAWTE